MWSGGTYAAFPENNPTLSSPGFAYAVTIYLTPTAMTNAALVADVPHDITNTYIYSSTVNNADLYGISTISTAFPTTVAVTSRACVQASDGGARTAAVQVKSGAAAAVAGNTVTLTSTGWQWSSRMDETDPNTGSAWTPAAVNALLVGPKVVS
jgi:hypothetical protein